MASGDAYPFSRQPPAFGYAIGIAAVALVFALHRAVGQLVDDGSLFLLLGTAVMATAWFAGTGPALAATVAGALLGVRLILPAEPDAAYRASLTHLALLVVHSLLLVGLVSELRRARRVSEQRANEALAARQASEEASRLKDEFLATVSHELRTPLNAVLGWLHLLRSGKLDAATASRGLESIERNVKLQAQLTGDLLDISKALTGKLHLESRPVSLADAARQAVLAATPAAQARGVLVTAHIPDGTVPILGDATRLRQIAWHLLMNGVKFTPRGGHVTLLLEERPPSAVLTVSDSGPGIDPAFLPRVFDRFTQADPSPTRTAGGLGVGLALVRDLVELHGGTVQACNRDGGGAVFSASFPLHAVEVERTRRAGADHPESPALLLDGLRVLVLDKDADGRDLLRTILQQRGAVVQTAESVGDALEALEAWRPDVLVSDSGTPDRDTYALVGKVQTLDADRGGRIPAAALTVAARADQKVKRLLQDVQRELPKPVEPGVLTAEIAQLTGRERRRFQRTS